MQKCRDMRWSGKKYVRRYHKSLNIAKALEKKVTGENYVWYSVRALHVTLLVLLFSLFIFSFISPLIWVGLGWKFSQMILHTSTSKMMNNLPFLLVVLHKPTLWPSTFNNGYPFPPKWPLKIGTGLAASAADPRRNQIWVPPPPPPRGF